MSASKENFIKKVYELDNDIKKSVKPGLLAGELGISNAAVTDMARKLSAKKLIHYERYGQIKLTPEGTKMAMDIIRKHRLWETFLYRTLDMTLHEIHREAEMLEHQTSDYLVEKISEFLGNPSFDPHGDPIPGKNGILKPDKKRLILSDAEAGNYYKVCRLSGSDKEFFEFCRSVDIKIGSKMRIEKQYEKNKITEIFYNDARLMLGVNITDKIFVEQITSTKS
ncbi:MAG: iron dependent repressor, metal binding and dimerization domain protein [Bacteroidota bacterium]